VEYAVVDPSDIYMALLDSLSSCVSRISIELGKGLNSEELIYLAHSKAIEIAVRGDCRKIKSLRKAEKLMFSLVDSVEVYGAESLIFIPPGKGDYNKETVAAIRKLASETHERGISFSVGLDAEKLEKFSPVALFDNVPSPERPDELRLLFGLHESSKEVSSPVSVDQIGAVLVRMHELKIPLSNISVEIPLSAFAWRSIGKKKIEPLELEPGKFETILQEAGEGGALRLGDGSLQLAYKGNIYAFDNLSGISSKVSFLSSGELSRIRGLYVRYDGLGVKPDGEGMKKLSQVFQK